MKKLVLIFLLLSNACALQASFASKALKCARYIFLNSAPSVGAVGASLMTFPVLIQGTKAVARAADVDVSDSVTPVLAGLVIAAPFWIGIPTYFGLQRMCAPMFGKSVKTSIVSHIPQMTGIVIGSSMGLGGCAIEFWFNPERFFFPGRFVVALAIKGFGIGFVPCKAAQLTWRFSKAQMAARGWWQVKGK